MSDDQALTREDLDQLPCMMPNCTADHPHARLTGNCHVGMPVEATYVSGALILRCAVCHEYVATIAVGARADRVARDKAPSGAIVYVASHYRTGPEAVFSDFAQADLYSVTGEFDLTALAVNQWPDQGVPFVGG